MMNHVLEQPEAEVNGLEVDDVALVHHDQLVGDYVPWWKSMPDR